MKKLLLAFAVLLIPAIVAPISAPAADDFYAKDYGVQLVPVGNVYVRGYRRKDGTYVRPHYRSRPDGNLYNNFLFPGNVNPYTGKVAPGNPDTYLRNYQGRGSNRGGLIPINPLVVPPAAPPLFESHRFPSNRAPLSPLVPIPGVLLNR